jgi:hypothetical protein
MPRIDAEVQKDERKEDGTYVGLHRLVYRTPPNVVFGGFFLDDALIRG